MSLPYIHMSIQKSRKIRRSDIYHRVCGDVIPCGGGIPYL